MTIEYWRGPTRSGAECRAIRWTAIVLGGLLLSAPAPAPAQDAVEAVPEVPEHVVEVASALVEYAPAIDRVWPGFWPEPRAYLLIDLREQELTVLFTPHEPLAGYSPVPDAELPAPLHGRLHVRVGAETRHTVDEAAPAPAPLVGPGGMANGYSQTEVILHEAFHWWQLVGWPDRHRRQPLDCTPQRYPGIGLEPPAGFGEAAIREMGILADAVAAEASEERLERVREYLRARLDRLLTADPLFAAVDQRQERREGSAQFTGLAGSLAVLDGGAAAWRVVLQDTLVAQLRDFRRLADDLNADADQEAAYRAYYTGAAMAFLLDASEAPSWRQAVERGEFFDLLLARAAGAHEYIRVLEERATHRPC